MINVNDVIRKMKAYSNPKSVEGMIRFGINPENALGVRIPVLRNLAREIGTNHLLAFDLWKSGIHEARILAGMIADPGKITSKDMDLWCRDFDSWDLCDQVCMNLFEKTEFAYRKAYEWCKEKDEFVKRAGFVMMARLAVADKKKPDSFFEDFLHELPGGSVDERNFVKKAVNWALRQIGKRSIRMNKLAVETAEEIKKIDSKSAKWIANDALRELRDEKIIKRLKS